MLSTGIKVLVVTVLWGPLTIAAQKDSPPIDADCPDGFVKQADRAYNAFFFSWDCRGSF